jgi:hypothetical protein
MEHVFTVLVYAALTVSVPLGVWCAVIIFGGWDTRQKFPTFGEIVAQNYIPFVALGMAILIAYGGMQGLKHLSWIQSLLFS